MANQQMDIRWEQRFSNFRKALNKLSLAIGILKPIIDNSRENDELSDIDELQIEGLIQRFEYTHELAWNVMSDYAKYQGYQDIKGSRDAIRYGLKNSLIDDARWMDTINDRNRTSHTYNEETAREIVVDIIEVYQSLFNQFESTMEELRTGYRQAIL